jgi:hypothetical protein
VFAVHIDFHEENLILLNRIRFLLHSIRQ